MTLTPDDIRALTAGLNDNDHVKCVGDTEWHHVGALRAQLRNNDHQENRIMPNNDFTPPDGYRAAVCELRAAIATLTPDFELRWRDDRLRELQEMRDALDAGPQAPRLTAAEEVEATPPDGYRLALQRDGR
jgi:hypothetical protein